MNEHIKNTDNLYGIWVVTTEGDCEGKSTKTLGCYRGFVDEIAFRLADKAYYALTFTESDELPLHPTKPDVEVCVYLRNRRSSDVTPSHFQNRPVRASVSNHYGCITLKIGGNSKEYDDVKNAIVKRQALSKLTESEIKALGL
jgi:hypothetical protein